MATAHHQPLAEFNDIMETITTKMCKSTGNYSCHANPMRVEFGFQVQGRDVDNAPGSVLHAIDSCAREAASRVALLDITKTFEWASWYHLRTYVQGFVGAWLRLLRFSVESRTPVPEDILRSCIDVGHVYNMMLSHKKSFKNKLSKLTPDFWGHAERAGVFAVDTSLLQVMLGARVDVRVARRIAHASTHATLVQMNGATNKQDILRIVKVRMHDLLGPHRLVPVTTEHAIALLRTILISLMPVETFSSDMSCNFVVAAVRYRHKVIHEAAVTSFVWTSKTDINKRKFVPTRQEVENIENEQGLYSFGIYGAAMSAMLRSAVQGDTIIEHLPGLGRGREDRNGGEFTTKDMTVFQVSEAIAKYVKYLHDNRNRPELSRRFGCFDVMLLAIFEKLYMPTYRGMIVQAQHGLHCDVANALKGAGLKWYPIPTARMLERAEGMVLAKIIKSPSSLRQTLKDHENDLAKLLKVDDSESEGFEERVENLNTTLSDIGRTLGEMCHVVVANLGKIHRRVHVKKTLLRRHVDN